MAASSKYPYTGVIDDEKNMPAGSEFNQYKAYGDAEPWPELSIRSPPSLWNAIREEWPVLASRSDEELVEAWGAYVKEPAELMDVLLKTPVGPVVLINVILAVLQRSDDFCGNAIVQCVPK